MVAAYSMPDSLEAVVTLLALVDEKLEKQIYIRTVKRLDPWLLLNQENVFAATVQREIGHVSQPPARILFAGAHGQTFAASADVFFSTVEDEEAFEDDEQEHAYTAAEWEAWVASQGVAVHEDFDAAKGGAVDHQFHGGHYEDRDFWDIGGGLYDAMGEYYHNHTD
ncbi:hypothetical protein CYMTET_25302 [Cymbomonas tetramitiformis]|uniref:Uncharacterized protein n=1 Tax=Cymbomonas tetramitiformis TaxID=36881 RepID=A0AAE0FUF3_9CHLO|nr:hypothetical protein CYMTET_25302 [Cymbomonas tetramitiformis]